MQSIFSLSLPNENDLYNPIPKITLQELESLLNNSNFDTNFSLDHLKDDGGNLGIIEISGLGSDYKNALKKLQNTAPTCIGNTKNRIPRKIPMPDGSYRKTYATTSKTYLDCLDMDVLSQAFDAIDSAMMKVLKNFNQHYSEDVDVNCSQLAYNVGERKVTIENALEKEHIHVYTKNQKKIDSLSQNKTSESLVPFHVDNGLFLIITPFPSHGMSVQISNGKTVSTSHVGLDSALVLIGRGLTEWLMSTNIAEKRHFFAVPHSVPTLEGSKVETRTVYARMKVPDPFSTTAMRDCTNFNGGNMEFQKFFNAGTHDHGVTKSHKLEKKDADGLFAKTLQHQCNEGEAYCWSICQTLPTECNLIEDAVCIDGHMLRCK